MFGLKRKRAVPSLVYFLNPKKGKFDLNGATEGPGLEQIEGEPVFYARSARGAHELKVFRSYRGMFVVQQYTNGVKVGMSAAGGTDPAKLRETIAYIMQEDAPRRRVKYTVVMDRLDE